MPRGRTNEIKSNLCYQHNHNTVVVLTIVGRRLVFASYQPYPVNFLVVVVVAAAAVVVVVVVVVVIVVVVVVVVVAVVLVVAVVVIQTALKNHPSPTH